MNSVEKSLNENKHALHSLVVFRRAANTISKKEMETIGYNFNVIKKQNYGKYLKSYYEARK